MGGRTVGSSITPASHMPAFMRAWASPVGSPPPYTASFSGVITACTCIARLRSPAFTAAHRSAMRFGMNVAKPTSAPSTPCTIEASRYSSWQVRIALAGLAARTAAMSAAYLFMSRWPTLKACTASMRARSAITAVEYEARVHAGYTCAIRSRPVSAMASK